MPFIDVLRELGQKLASRNLPWHRALHAAASEPIVDEVSLRIAQVELGDDVARQIYEDARDGALMVEEVPFESLTTVERSVCDRASTETGESDIWTVNQLILRLVSMVDIDPDIGKMQVTVSDCDNDMRNVTIWSHSDRAVVVLQ